MSDNSLHIDFIKSGLLVQAQDMGRFGFQDSGVPQSGALDKKAAMLANILLGQDINTPVFEITYAGPSIQFSGACQLAITGADISAKLNHLEIPMYSTIKVQADDKISYGRLFTGCRSYLAIRGKWMINRWLNSVSPLLYDDHNLTIGNSFKKGDRIKIEKLQAVPNKQISAELFLQMYEPNILRILPGPESELFSEKELNALASQSFSLSNDCNRMGCRINESLNDYTPKKEILSSAIIPGTIQITHSGKPIILLADAQTTGGYPRIANIISADLDRVAQMKPGDSVHFEIVSLEKAVKINKEHQSYWSSLMEKLI